VHFQPQPCSFLEDYLGTDERARRVHFRNGYKHNLSGGWTPLASGTFNVLREAPSRVYENAYDTGVLDDTSFYLQSGGKTVPSEKALEKGAVLERSMAAEPDTHVLDLLSSQYPQ